MNKQSFSPNKQSFSSNKKIWVNTIVNNEDSFIWFAIMSVIDFVDEILIYDTGSSDKTLRIIDEIKKIKGNKISFKEIGKINPEKVSNLRQKMLEESDCDWILILDGDEVWWEASIKQLVNKINKEGDEINAIVVPTIIPVGDIYHIQEAEAGRYEILGHKGHFNLRAINKKIPGLHVDLPHPQEGYFDKDNKPIQEGEKTIFLEAPYFHLTHLKRSSQERGVNKFKYEIGDKINSDFIFPEVFKRDHPDIVPNPWIKLFGFGKTKAQILTPFRKLKRRILNG